MALNPKQIAFLKANTSSAKPAVMPKLTKGDFGVEKPLSMEHETNLKERFHKLRSLLKGPKEI